MIRPLWAVVMGSTNKKKCQAYYSRALEWYPQFIRKPTPYGRVPLEIAVFVSACRRAYAAVVLKRDVMIRHESFATGEPDATISPTFPAISSRRSIRRRRQVSLTKDRTKVTVHGLFTACPQGCQRVLGTGSAIHRLSTACHR